MFGVTDGRESVEDWYFLENQKRSSNNANSPEGDGRLPSDQPTASARKRTKDFIENELHAMSTLSLYDDSVDKMKMPGDADKWV